LVENQLKNTAKAYTGFQPIMLRKVQTESHRIKEEEGRNPKVLGIMKIKYFLQAKKTQKEEIGAKRNEHFNEGDELLVENQLKTLAKAYPGFRLIMLRDRKIQEEIEEKKDQERRKMNELNESKEEEKVEEKEREEFYYNEKGDKMEKNQLEKLTKVITGNQIIMLSNNEVQKLGTKEKHTKSEVQTNQRIIISGIHKCSSARIIIMAKAYSGIEQVSS
jgi:hypothetical protein